MRSTRTLIVDDELAARNGLRHLLADEPAIDMIGECRNGRDAVEWIRVRKPELVFLDIQMPLLDGFGVLRELKPEELPVIVFVTAYDRYALRAFEVHAIDYLLKPFSDARFQECLAEAQAQVRRRRLGDFSSRVAALVSDFGAIASAAGGAVGPSTPTGGTRYTERLLVRTGERVTPIQVADIDWIDADGDYVRLHIGKVGYLLRSTMRHIEEQLDPRHFARVHRSTILNLDRVKELKPCYRSEYVAVLHDGMTLKLSRRSRKALELRLGRKL